MNGLALLLLAQLAVLAGFAATAWAAGWLALGRKRPELLLHPVTPTCGLAVLAAVMTVLAFCGLFRSTPLAAMAAATHLAALPGWRQVAARLRAAVRTEPRRSVALALAGIAAGAPGLAIGLYPPTAFDETTYHLAFARELAETGALPFLPQLRVPVFPLLGETLQAALYLVGGDRATHLVALLATLLTAALLVAWGAEAGWRAAGWLAAAAWLGSPLVAYLAGTGYVEAPLALFASGSVYAAWRARRGSGPWAAVAGGLAGSAAAVKYLGLFFVGALPALLLAAALAPVAGRGRTLARQLAGFALAALAALAPTYLRLHAVTGNPVFPFYAEKLSRTAYDPPPAPDRHRVAGAVRLPLDAVVERDRVGRQPPLSPAFPLALALVLPLAASSRRARPGAAVLLGYLAVFLVVPPDARYLAPILPTWALLGGVAAAAGWQRLRRGEGGRRLAALTGAILVAPGLAYGVFHVQRQGPVPTDGAARERYLARQLPAYSLLAAWRDGGRPGTSLYALHAEHLHGFADGRLLGEHSGPYAHPQVAARLGSPAALHRVLRAMGATHLLVRRQDVPRSALRSRPDLFVLRRADADGELYELR